MTLLSDFFVRFTAFKNSLDAYTSRSLGSGIEDNVQTAFFGIIGVLGLILSGYLILSYRRKETFNVFLGIFTLTTSLILIELTLDWWEAMHYDPKVPFYKSLVFLWGPSLHLYLKSKARPGNTNISYTSTLRHYIIFTVSLLLLSIIGNVDMDYDSSKYSPSWFILTFLTNNWVKSIYSSFYLLLLIREYYGYEKSANQLSKTWAKLLISYFAFLLVIKIFRAEFDTVFAYDFLSKYLAAYCFSSFILILGSLNILFPKNAAPQSTTEENNEEKYKNSGLTKDMLFSLKEQLVKAMKEDKLFLDHKLTLQTLAETLNTDRYSLSQVINQEFHKNFYEFINDYRINESVRIIKRNPDRVHLVVDLIYESGFNNKVSFYRAFKKRKGMTPAKYIKEFSTIA
ncbi:helix-turn-helix domain-containing protein [Maribacter chungangensis]|uniref:Helix-turn-helix domain-containing protein n=1 Tax=Maribacter chungangensis TaxID=1069117 RepID=A0ABW3B2B7_9FLAO